GNWRPDEPLFLGRFGLAVAWIALVWLALEIVNVLWPREAAELWVVNFAPLIASVGIGLLGVFAFRCSPIGRGAAPVDRQLSSIADE
ncbi:MAG TPA: hypothetical protein VFL67_01620, partial [Mycobacterium sp.]|nr:hypothetical protein [Mycobacterium sp.]